MLYIIRILFKRPKKTKSNKQILGFFVDLDLSIKQKENFQKKIQGIIF